MIYVFFVLLRKTESRSANKFAKAPFWPNDASTVNLMYLGTILSFPFVGIGVTKYVCLLNGQVKRSFICMVSITLS
jgi:hypothetical protein